MARGLRGLDHPGREAARLAGLGHLRAGRLLATAVMRAWLPAALVVAMRSRRARVALAACALVPAGLDWWERRPALDPIRYGALRVLDDAAYCAGLWVGCLAEGTVGPLLPDLTGLSVPAPVRRLLRGARSRPPSWSTLPATSATGQVKEGVPDGRDGADDPTRSAE
jgi:mycofactocin glycosyltransferase